MVWISRLAIAAAAMLAAAALAAAWTWQRSESRLAVVTPPPAFAAPIPTDAASLATGHRLALTRGCYSCHGARLEGEVHPWAGRAVAVNLARYTRDHGPAVFERALRHGIGHDGRALYSMPSFNFVRLRDADVAALYAWLRTVPVAVDILPAPRLDWPTRWALANGSDLTIPEVVPMVPTLAWQRHPDPAVRRGEYLAMTSCNECHGLSLRSDSPFEGDPAAPDLALVASYQKPDFIHLMRTGRPPGNRDLGLMTRTAQNRFVHWTDAEVDDLHAFLTAMGQSATRQQENAATR